jgi:hypothetical protein
MKKLILLALVGTGFAATMPFKANAIESHSIQQLDRTPALTIAQMRRNDRQFNVYYRNRGDRSWILENSYSNRREAERASRRLERRGYNTYVQLSREVGRRFG